MNILVVDVDGP